MSLQGHEKAARILADCFGEGAAALALVEHQGGAIDQTVFHMMTALEDTFRLAANRMEDAIRAEASGRAGS